VAVAGGVARDGFGVLGTGGLDASARYAYWGPLGVGLGATAGIAYGSLQECILGCTAPVEFLSVYAGPIAEPLILIGGDHREHNFTVQLSWPLAILGMYSGPTLTLRYTYML
jgi:hypothetical protein